MVAQSPVKYTIANKPLNGTYNDLVLLIENSFLDLFVAEKLIRKNLPVGELLSVPSTEEALIYLAARDRDGLCFPKLIFLNIYMAEASGFEFLDRFSTFSPGSRANCKLVVMTSSVSRREREKVQSYRSVQRFIVKPLTNENLKGL
jgi:CheY-like chemotaxis protein